MAEWTTTGAALVAGADDRTSWRIEAASWLLAEHGYPRSHWPEQLDAAGLVEWFDETNGEDVPAGTPGAVAFVRWLDLAEALGKEPLGAKLMGTGSEMGMLRFAVGLVNGRGGNWGAHISSLDSDNQRIVLGAMAWAMGGRAAAHVYLTAPVG